MFLSSTEPQTYRTYALVDPVTRLPHYVGQTADLLGRRLEQHVKKRQETKKGLWIRDLIRAEQWPEIVLLEEFLGTRRRAYERESYWIQQLRGQGHPILN